MVQPDPALCSINDSDAPESNPIELPTAVQLEVRHDTALNTSAPSTGLGAAFTVHAVPFHRSTSGAL